MTIAYDRTLDENHPRLACRYWGRSEMDTGEGVIALHGWLDNAATFDRLVPLLPTLPVAAIDLPGHGLSGHRQDCLSYHFLDWVPEVFRAADKLGWKRFGLLGHSMGAAVATLVAGTFPERVKGVALLEGLVPLTESPSEGPQRLARYVERLSLKPSRKPAIYSSIEEATEVRMGAGQFETAEGIRLVVRRNLKETENGWVWRSDPKLKRLSAFRMSLDQVEAYVRRIQSPTLVIHATDGLRFDAASVERLASAFSSLESHEVQGFHHVHLDAPERLAETVGQFLRSL